MPNNNSEKILAAIHRARGSNEMTAVDRYIDFNLMNVDEHIRKYQQMFEKQAKNKTRTIEKEVNQRLAEERKTIAEVVEILMQTLAVAIIEDEGGTNDDNHH